MIHYLMNSPLKLVYTSLLALSLLLGTFTVALMPACSSTQQTVTYKTLYSLENLTLTAYDAYMDHVIAGKTRTNDVPKISKAFNTFQASMATAVDAAQFNTNALAPTSLMILSEDLINLINTARKN